MFYVHAFIVYVIMCIYIYIRGKCVCVCVRSACLQFGGLLGLQLEETRAKHVFMSSSMFGRSFQPVKEERACVSWMKVYACQAACLSKLIGKAGSENTNLLWASAKASMECLTRLDCSACPTDSAPKLSEKNARKGCQNHQNHPPHTLPYVCSLVDELTDTLQLLQIAPGGSFCHLPDQWTPTALARLFHPGARARECACHVWV